MKKILLMLLMACLIILSGCGNVDEEKIEEMKEDIRESIKFEEYQDYLTYQQYIENEKLDSEGYYSDEAFALENQEEFTEKLGSIHVTFAYNSSLNVQYFLDKEGTKLLNTSDCYLNPGDSVYAAVEVDKHVNSSKYVFKEFRVYTFDDEGEREIVDDMNDGSPNLVLDIPSTFKGTELSVEPIGQFEACEIELLDYYKDENGRKNNLTGTWYFDDKSYETEYVEISPVASYIIRYEYDPEKYFYISSNPECYYVDNSEGKVIFKQREATDEIEQYEVELHPYISVEIKSEKSRNVKINGEKTVALKANQKLEIPKLRYGERVTLYTDVEWSDLENFRELILVASEIDDAAELRYKYTLIVPEKDGQFEFNPSEYTYAHGSLIFKCFGEVVTETQYLAKGTKIYYEQKTVDEGYWLPLEENYIVVGEEEDTKELLNSIQFKEMIQVTVNLKQPEYGGTITYKMDGQVLTGDTVSTYNNKIIEMDFDLWEGWLFTDAGIYDGIKYTVTDKKIQDIKVNTLDVSKIFSEDLEHKPELKLVLHESIGAMKVSVSASGLEKKEYTFEKKLFRQENAFEEGKIGTEKGIQVTFMEKTPTSEQALKYLIEKVDKNGKTSVDAIYITDITKQPEPIAIYENIADGKAWYESIKITISIEEVTPHEIETIPNAAMKLVVAETGKELQKGDVLEDNQKVIVTITPQAGFYVEGKHVSDIGYEDTMSYKDYKKNKMDIINEHAIKKLVKVTLDSSDAYGTVTYTIKKKDKSGTEEKGAGEYSLKQGDTIILEYKVNDEYEIVDDDWFFSKKSVTKKIDVDEKMDASTIRREDYIEVRAKEKK